MAISVTTAISIALLAMVPSPAVAGAMNDDPSNYSGREAFVAHDIGEPLIEVRRAGAAAEVEIRELAVLATGAQSGMVVADIGFGSGGHALKLSGTVGDEGTVVCREISASQVAAMRTRAHEAGLDNFDIEVSTNGDVSIESETLDVALLADVYNIVLYQRKTKRAFVESLFEAMKPGGVVVVCYVETGMLQDKSSRESTIMQTMRGFMEAGFEPGKRYEFVEETHRPLVLEFRRPH